jgi:serine protease Do
MIIRILQIFPVILALAIGAAAHAQERVLPPSAQHMQMSFAPIVKQVAPAVVNIYTKRTVSQKMQHPFLSDPFFSPFFRDELFGGRMRKQVESALGSGVIIEAGGVVVTNAHVIKGAEEITVVLSDGREFEASLMLMDEPSDLALLQMNADGQVLPFAPLRPSETLQVGDLVLAIGNPFGVGQTVTSGIVSALARSSLNISDFNFFIQTDAAINPGNSGGALVALDGGVVGINTAIYSRDGGSLGIGFAIPSEMVASVLAAAKNGQSGARGVTRPWLGVTMQNLTPDIAQSLDMDRPYGGLVAALHPASPLKKSGIQVGDVVLSINGREIRDAAELKFRMATVPLGEKAEIEISRQGERRTFSVAAMAPPDDPPRAEMALQGPHPFNGATIANLNPAVAIELGINADDVAAAVILSVNPGTQAAAIMVPGDLILEINGLQVSSVQDVEAALKKPGNGWAITLNRQGRVQQLLIR